MSLKSAVKSILFPAGDHKRRIVGGALKGFNFLFNLRVDTQAWRGIYEQCLQDWLQTYTQPGAVCLDIGAANGYFALLMAKLAGPTGQVYAFEPSSLTQNIQDNFALNNDRPLAPLRVFDALVVESNGDGRQHIVIDDLTNGEHLARVDIVKIDVDGAEMEVLRGMAQTLERFHPHLFVEVHSRELLAEVEQFVKGYGYVMQLQHPPPHELRPLTFNSFLFSQNT